MFKSPVRYPINMYYLCQVCKRKINTEGGHCVAKPVRATSGERQFNNVNRHVTNR